MSIRMRLMVGCVYLASVHAALALSEEAKKKYDQVTFKQLKVVPEDYKNKKVTYTDVFHGFSTTFPPYVEKSGFKVTKYFYLKVGGLAIPVMAKKSDEMNTLMVNLDRGATVRLYGKIKKFRSKPVHTTYPRYYLALEELDVVAAPKVGQPWRGGEGDDGGGAKPHRPRRRR